MNRADSEAKHGTVYWVVVAIAVGVAVFLAMVVMLGLARPDDRLSTRLR